MEAFHVKLCEKITQDGSDNRVVLLGKHAYKKCNHWFPKEKVINDGRLLHGSQIGRRFVQDESQQDSFLNMMNRAEAFRSGIKLNPFLDSSKKNNYLKFTPKGTGGKKHKQDPAAAAA